MAKGRSTTWQERVDIVLYCLAHNHEYQKAAHQNEVSYRQVYQWVNRKPSSNEQENVELTRVMMSIYEKVDRTFGYRQLTLHMRRQTGFSRISDIEKGLAKSSRKQALVS
ncbi:helix-turn-helix domain-containing protein [Paenibacillus thiaminolyticus]|nr:helix-turn-helix domain-containing protein [Paenibacillus thiaminolyticus]